MVDILWALQESARVAYFIHRACTPLARQYQYATHLLVIHDSLLTSFHRHAVKLTTKTKSLRKPLFARAARGALPGPTPERARDPRVDATLVFVWLVNLADTSHDAPLSAEAIS